jgi:hypothetical protein
MHMAAGLRQVQEGSVSACSENKNKKVRHRALHRALHPRPLSWLYSKFLNLAFLVHGLWLCRPLLQGFVLHFLHLFVYLSLCSYYYSMHCLRTFQLNETETLFTSRNDRVRNVCARGDDKRVAGIGLKLELELICCLAIVRLAFIRRSTNLGSNQSQMSSKVALLHCFHTSASASCTL